VIRVLIVAAAACARRALGILLMRGALRSGQAFAVLEDAATCSPKRNSTHPHRRRRASPEASSNFCRKLAVAARTR